MRVPARYSESFPSSPASAQRAREAVRKLVSTVLDAREATDFESAVGECLANFVEHGGGSVLTVTCLVRGDNIIAEVGSDGPGFLPSEIIPPPVGAIRGYGLFLMRTLVDSIEFSDDGRKMRLLKRLREKRCDRETDG